MYIAKTRIPISKYIDIVFDMNIQKCFFDGDKLYAKNWTKLIDRKDYVKPNSIVCEYDGSTVTDIMCNMTIQIYNKFNFDVKKHPKYDEMKQSILEYITKKSDDQFAFDLSTFK